MAGRVIKERMGWKQRGFLRLMEKGHKDGGWWYSTNASNWERGERIAAWEAAMELAINRYRLALPADRFRQCDEDDEPVQTVDTSFPALEKPSKPSLDCHASSFASLTARKERHR
jgi:hypothetical protein